MTSILTLQQRKKAFAQLGDYLLSDNARLASLISAAHQYNGWFTPQETSRAVNAFGKLLNETNIEEWTLKEAIPETNSFPKKIGLVLAGNVPMVGLHDILSVLITGHIALIKLSSQDRQLIPHILTILTEIEPAFTSQILFTERFEGFDAIIATGSNNTSRYFEYYFARVPHIIRKNRNSVAVLTGKESPSTLYLLGRDIFDYFGLGCRNVSKIFVPEGYNFTPFFEAIEPYKSIIDHHKYNNNYDYNKSIYLVNKEAHLDNGFILLKEDTQLASPLAVLYYEQYDTMESVQSKIRSQAGEIQCLVCGVNLEAGVPEVQFGESQQPKLSDYADRINTISFLLKL